MTFERLAAAFGELERDVTIVPASHQVGRLEIYKERWAFRARMSGYDSRTNGIGETETSMQFQPVGEIRKLRAEWWRLGLWYALAPLRLWQRFRAGR
jgi:hypothetical protein